MAPMELWLLVLRITGYAFLTCAVIAVFTLRGYGWQRFIPIATVVAFYFPILTRLLPFRPFHLFTSIFCPLLAVILLIYTLRRTWSGKQLIERVLRVLCIVYLLLVARFVFFAGIP